MPQGADEGVGVAVDPEAVASASQFCPGGVGVALGSCFDDEFAHTAVGDAPCDSHVFRALFPGGSEGGEVGGIGEVGLIANGIRYFPRSQGAIVKVVEGKRGTNGVEEEGVGVVYAGTGDFVGDGQGGELVIVGVEVGCTADAVEGGTDGVGRDLDADGVAGFVHNFEDVELGAIVPVAGSGSG